MPENRPPNFQLPPKISFQKELGPTGWYYLFRHQELGELGRILLQERPDGNTQIIIEIVGDSDDPMTEQRKSIFGPVAMEITRQMDLATGGDGSSGPSDLPPYQSPPGPLEGFESKHIQCETCNAFVAVLIFADNAKYPSGLEDCARLMFPKVKEWDLPSWVIGPHRSAMLRLPSGLRPYSRSGPTVSRSASCGQTSSIPSSTNSARPTARSRIVLKRRR